MQGYICVCVLAYSDWLITDSVVAHASMSVFSHHRDGFSCLHLEYSTVPVKVFWAQIQTICVLPPFNSLQEDENGGYCSTENAIREWRAYGPELSHEDFTKFHEVSYQYIHKKTHFLSCTTKFSNDDLQSYFFHGLVISSIRSSNFHPLVFHLAYALLSSFRVPTIMKCLEISLDFKIVISRPGKSWELVNWK